jgi:hypothetical protein
MYRTWVPFGSRAGAGFRGTDIYTKYGIAGVLLGIVTPLCLFALAAYTALGAKWRR